MCVTFGVARGEEVDEGEESRKDWRQLDLR